MQAATLARRCVVAEIIPVETQQVRNERAAFAWLRSLFKLNDVCDAMRQHPGNYESLIFACSEDLSQLRNQPHLVRLEVRRLLCEIISEQGNAVGPAASEGLLIVTYVFGEWVMLEQAADILQGDRQKVFQALEAIVERASASGCTRREFSAYISQTGGMYEALKQTCAETSPRLNRGEETAHA